MGYIIAFFLWTIPSFTIDSVEQTFYPHIISIDAKWPYGPSESVVFTSHVEGVSFRRIFWRIFIFLIDFFVFFLLQFFLPFINTRNLDWLINLFFFVPQMTFPVADFSLCESCSHLRSDSLNEFFNSSKFGELIKFTLAESIAFINYFISTYSKQSEWNEPK